MKFDIQIKGLEELRRRWATAPTKVRKMTMDALTRSGYLVEGASKRVTPVDTGRLRNSISLSSSLALRAEPHVVVSPHTNYALTVHEGLGYGKNSVARPFMTQGYEAAKNRIKNEMRSLLRNIVKELK
jgi:HK97 gp10 family phage protein